MTTQQSDAARLLSIAMEAIRRFVPTNYVVRVTEDMSEFPKCGTDLIPYSASEFDKPSQHYMLIPPPTDLWCLFILLHEVGHVANQHGQVMSGTQQNERAASEWAQDFLTCHGIVLPAEIWAEAQRLWELTPIITDEEIAFRRALFAEFQARFNAALG